MKNIGSKTMVGKRGAARGLAFAAVALGMIGASVVAASPAQADFTCNNGDVCMFTGSDGSGTKSTFSSYNSGGSWQGVPSAQVDAASSLFNGQYGDGCNNNNSGDSDPWVYFADSGPNGKVGALFFGNPAEYWSSIGYYDNKIDSRYNRCGTAAPSYTPHGA